MRFCGLLVLMFVLSGALNARADWLFTWHYVYPQFQKFQGSFEVTDAEIQPSATFNSDLFRNSISITSPEGIAYRGDDPNWSDANGSFAPNPNLFMTLHDSSHSITLDVFANGPTFEGDLYEFFPGGPTIQEHGWWAYQQIPEPSVSTLVGVAGIIWFVKRRR